MSTTANLPFYVKDMRMWPFLKACNERHLDGSGGLVGKALLTHCSCFCEDVTKLSEEEYPLVHNACMNGLTGCFATFLHNIETNEEYVLEIFLPPDIKDSGQVRHLVQTLNQNVLVGSGFELGDTSSILIDLYVNMYSDVSQTSSDCMDDSFMNPIYLSDSESVYSPATEMVTAMITCNDIKKSIHFLTSSGLLDLKYKVADIFEIECGFRLKYVDEDDDEIMIAKDVDLEFAVNTTAINNCINLICYPGN